MCKQWIGIETKCERCQGALKKGEHFYDAVMRMPGRYPGASVITWALVCESCYNAHHVYGSLGVGKGQKYRSSDNMKAEG